MRRRPPSIYASTGTVMQKAKVPQSVSSTLRFHLWSVSFLPLRSDFSVRLVMGQIDLQQHSSPSDGVSQFSHRQSAYVSVITFLHRASGTCHCFHACHTVRLSILFTWLLIYSSGQRKRSPYGTLLWTTKIKMAETILQMWCRFWLLAYLIITNLL